MIAFIEAVVDLLTDVLCSVDDGLKGRVIFGMLGVDVLTRPRREGVGVLASSVLLMAGSALLERAGVVAILGRDSFPLADVDRCERAFPLERDDISEVMR